MDSGVEPCYTYGGIWSSVLFVCCEPLETTKSCASAKFEIYEAVSRVRGVLGADQAVGNRDAGVRPGVNRCAREL
jgi:hypothetical protein